MPDLQTRAHKYARTCAHTSDGDRHSRQAVRRSSGRCANKTAEDAQTRRATQDRAQRRARRPLNSACAGCLAAPPILCGSARLVIADKKVGVLHVHTSFQIDSPTLTASFAHLRSSKTGSMLRLTQPGGQRSPHRERRESRRVGGGGRQGKAPRIEAANDDRRRRPVLALLIIQGSNLQCIQPVKASSYCLLRFLPPVHTSRCFGHPFTRICATQDILESWHSCQGTRALCERQNKRDVREGGAPARR